MDTEPQYYTTEEVAARYRRKPSTIRWWRHIGYGPRAVPNSRLALYPRAEVEKFDAQLAAEAASTRRP